jgi:hypothetical protein
LGGVDGARAGIEEGIEDFKNSNTTSWDDFIVNYL